MICFMNGVCVIVCNNIRSSFNVTESGVAGGGGAGKIGTNGQLEALLTHSKLQ